METADVACIVGSLGVMLTTPHHLYTASRKVTGTHEVGYTKVVPKELLRRFFNEGPLPEAEFPVKVKHAIDGALLPKVRGR